MNGTFLQRMLRLKLKLGVHTDKEVAVALGMSATALNERKRRDAFPVDRLCKVASLRPELGIDLSYVLNGIPSTAAEPIGHDEQLLRHTLNRIAPAMADGFTITTSYGDLAIEPGPLAERIRDLVALDAELQLARQEKNHG